MSVLLPSTLSTISCLMSYSSTIPGSRAFYYDQNLLISNSLNSVSFNRSPPLPLFSVFLSCEYGLMSWLLLPFLLDLLSLLALLIPWVLEHIRSVLYCSPFRVSFPLSTLDSSLGGLLILFVYRWFGKGKMSFDVLVYHMSIRTMRMVSLSLYNVWIFIFGASLSYYRANAHTLISFLQICIWMYSVGLK
jgi:hypothetical protein